jgi:hypothetical protein
MVHDILCIDHIHQMCADCISIKIKRSMFPSQAKWWADGLLDLVHGDLCGPIAPAIPDSMKYFLLLVDDRRRFMWVTLLAAKSDTLAVVKMFKVKVKVEVETGRHLCVLRTDNGGEFTSIEF